MFKWVILVVCLHAKYGHMRVDWNNADASHDSFVPMMMDEDDTYRHSSYQNEYGDKHPISSLKNFPYRVAQRYHPKSYDKCDRYSPNYSPQHPDCKNDRCDKTSINYMPNHPDCANKCDPNSITYQPNHPDCGRCDPNSINFMPNDPSCPVPPECPVPDPCNKECPNFDACNEDCPSFDKCDMSCPTFDKCDESCASFDECDASCPSFDECNENCSSFDECNEDCPSFDECNENCSNFNECNENCASFDPCNKDCPVNNPTKCNPGCPDFDRCDDDCTEADKTGCETDFMCEDPCDSRCENFDPDLEDCKVESKCQVMLSSINTTACQISEEFQAMTCGECPDADIDIEELTDACRNPSADLIDCMATIGSMQNENGQTCKMYEFKFIRSTMSPKCFKPKPKYPSYSKPEPRYLQRYVQRQPNKSSYPAHYQAPRKLFYKPKKMVVVVRKRYI